MSLENDDNNSSEVKAIRSQILNSLDIQSIRLTVLLLFHATGEHYDWTNPTLFYLFHKLSDQIMGQN
ncbi:2105_t:CDS:2 [Entrophospora sp. SA101]|nr:16219_t:CDS:2 [Entrophospora sp. SA101]CAJ0765126.1 2101_t:CDS:2 [Entrophospora sp. SA101]CAJ0765130.1 2105_t:CDS:2 [Entrophospora sp. SA101]CAJ0919472.1 20684_t:CDS:2 [Entrophospora sp. SA101]